jgi:hypothetical protein
MNQEPNNQAGKGDTNRPFNGDLFRQNYDEIFRKKEVIRDGRDEDFDSHDEDLYNEPLTKFGI